MGGGERRTRTFSLSLSLSLSLGLSLSLTLIFSLALALNQAEDDAGGPATLTGLMIDVYEWKASSDWYAETLGWSLLRHQSYVPNEAAMAITVGSPVPEPGPEPKPKPKPKRLSLSLSLSV